MIVKVKDLKPNPNNPRYIRDEKFEKLKKSIQDFPEMLKLRPVVVDDDMVVLGGNMRLKALTELGIDEVEAIKAKALTEKQKAEFIIKDNVGFGDWDWDLLANDWDSQQLNDWGLDVWQIDDLSNEGEYAGADPELELDKFLNSELKRMFFVYDNQTFERVVNWLNSIQSKYDLQSHSDAILKLMENEHI